ncbi:MAG: right-handed parallel beta-helix repeat-containing protein [Verrucomicrobiales bacterium]|nr:right-handed parallel beta-helix repeat-containing protein [Verrucomicrobiales bacterium]
MTTSAASSGLRGAARKAARWRGTLVVVGWLTGLLAPSLVAQPILILADGLTYTFRVPATPLPSDEFGFTKVFVRVGPDAGATEPVLEFSGNELSEERTFTRAIDEALLGQTFQIRITRQSFGLAGGVVTPGEVAPLGQSDFVVGPTQGVLFEDTVWTTDRLIEGSSLATRLFGGLHVPRGVRLTIAAGVTVDGFDPQATGNRRQKAPMLVEGRLIVEPGARLKSLNLNNDVLPGFRTLREEESRLTDVELEDVIADFHGAGVVLDGVRCLDANTRVTVRPFGEGDALQIRNSVFTQPLTIDLPHGEGAVPARVVIQGCEFGRLLTPVFTSRTLVVKGVPADVEIAGNLFRGGGVDLTAAEGRGFLIADNRSTAPGVIPPNRTPSEEFAVRLEQQGAAGDSERRVEGNDGISRLDLWADGIIARNNRIILSSLQDHVGVIAGVYLAGTDCVVERNTITGTRGDAGQDTSTRGVLIGALDFDSPRTDGVPEFNRNRVLDNEISQWGRGIHLRSGAGHRIEGNEIFRNWQNFVLGDDRAGPDAPAPGAGNRFIRNHLHSFQGPAFNALDSTGNFRAYGPCAVTLCPIEFAAETGNRWSDYPGADLDGDGIGDTPHVLGTAGEGTYLDPLPIVELPPPDEIVVNRVGDEADADPNDNVADVDLATPGLQTTLRAALEVANATPGPDLIRFDFSSGGPATGAALIRPRTPLPAILEAATIDASSIPGGVQIDGIDLAPEPALAADEPAPAAGLRIIAPSGVVLRGLAITAFQTGIHLEDGENHAIENCRIGVTQALALPELGNGVGIHGINLRRLVIAGCVIGHNRTDGIRLDGVVEGSIRGCAIGLSPNLDPLPNGTGIHLRNSLGCRVGGPDASSANRIAASRLAGIAIFDREASDDPHLIAGNFIGALDDTSADDRFGNLAGVLVESPESHRIEGNRIAFNRDHGIDLLPGAFNGQPAPTRAILLDNRIHDNGGAGIEANAPGPDRGAIPELAFETQPDGPALQRDRLSARFLAAAGQRIRFQLFSNTRCDLSSFGEGESPFATLDVTADAGGLAAALVDIPPDHLGRFYTATATLLTSAGEPFSTTEFGPCLGALIVNFAEDLPDAQPGDGIADVDLETEGLQTSLRAALETAREIPGTDLILFDLPPGGNAGEPASVPITRSDLPAIDHPVELDGRLLRQPDARAAVVSQDRRLFQFLPGSDGSRLGNLALASLSPAPLIAARNTATIVLDGLEIESEPALEPRESPLVAFDRVAQSVIANSTFAKTRRRCVELSQCTGVVVGGATVIDGVEVPQGNRFTDFDQAVAILGVESVGNEFSHNVLRSAAIGPDVSGLRISEASECRVADNQFDLVEIGIVIEGEAARRNRVQRNRILTTSTALRMSAGVWIRDGSSDNVIGAGPDEPVANGNTFAAFATAIAVSNGTGNRLVGNRFERPGRTSACIDLGYVPPRFPDENTRTPNDADPGPPTLANRFQNHPELRFLDADDGVIFGELVSAPDSAYLIEVLGGFGARHLGFVVVTTGPDGRGGFTFQTPSIEGLVHFTATDAFGNTSEVSPTVLVYTVNSTRNGPAQADRQFDGLNTTGQAIPAGEERSLRAALEDATRAFDLDPETTVRIHFRIPVTEADAIPEIDGGGAPLPEIRFPVELGLAPDPQDVARFIGALGAAPERFAVNLRVTVVPGQPEPARATGEAAVAGLQFTDVDRARLGFVNLKGFPGGGLRIDGGRSVEVSSGDFVENGTPDGTLVPAIEVLGPVDQPGTFDFRDLEVAGNHDDGLRFRLRHGATRIRVEQCRVLANGNGIVVEGLGEERLDVQLQDNLVGDQRFNGIELDNASGVVVTGNRIGLDSDTRSRPNGLSGLVLRRTAHFNEIGGDRLGLANQIGANRNAGIALIGPEVRFNEILGNVIGDPFADGAFGNQTGVLVQEARDNHIGRPGAGNEFLRNRDAGVALRGLNGNAARDNQVAGNRFLANEIGVLLDLARANVVGAREDRAQGAEAGNEFLAGHTAAIRVLNGLDNIFSANRIVGNRLAIELLEGSHDGLEAPGIVGVAHDGERLEVQIAHVRPLTGTVVYELFANPEAGLNPRAFCESARTFLGRATLDAGDGGGPVVRVLSVDARELAGATVSATLTLPGIGTSPLSNCHPVSPLDRDGDGASDAAEDALAPGSSEDPRRSAVPGFRAPGEPARLVPIRVDPGADGNDARFRSTGGGTIDIVPVPPPAGVEFPFGVLGFSVEVDRPGAAATIRLGPIPAEVSRFNCLYKLARRTADGEPEWFCLEGAVFDPGSREWAFTLRDGEIGDFDLVRDAFIIDPLALAFDPALPPLEPGVRLGIGITPAGWIVLRVTGRPGARYRLEATGSLTPPVAWQDTGRTGTANATGLLEFSETPADTPRFHRVAEIE